MTLRRHWIQVAGILTWVTACAVAYIIDPQGSGGVAFMVCAGISITGIGLGPVIRRARPLSLWANLAAGAVFFLLSLMGRLLESPPALGALALPDALCFLGYALIGVFLVRLLRRNGTVSDDRLWLDTLLVTVGASLALWVVTISPRLDSDASLGESLVAAIYPLLDVALLALSAQFVFRVTTRSPVMWAFFLGLGIMQLVDTAYTFVWTVEPGRTIPALSALFLYAYVAVAYGACHPSVAGISERCNTAVRPPLRSRRSAILLSMMPPVILSTAYPYHGAEDVVTRSVLLAALFGLIFTRLNKTMSALSDAEEESRHRAIHDGLTGLPNRVAFTEELELRLARTASADPMPWVNVLFIDCDNFKHVNDTWGHPVGDSMLIEVASRLRTVIRLTDVLARVGGDEFMIVVNSAHAVDAVTLAERVLDAFATPMELTDDHAIRMTPSIGIAQSLAGTGTLAEHAVRDADIALYRAKEGGRARWALFDEPLREQVSQRVLLAEAMQGAIAAGQIDMDLQPIMGGAGYGTLVGWESLARWLHPEYGQISPSIFIPIAEDTGLILDIGELMLRRSCEEIGRLRAESGRDDLHISVNVSPAQMTRSDFPALVARVLEETGLPPEALWLEITESIIVERGAEATAMLSDLHALGVTLCMDDFGTGYSSLGSLHEFPLDIVKVDQSFVRNLANDPRAVAVTRAIIEMVTALNLAGVVAEGVETPEQAAVLAQLRCSMVQGWHYGRPTPVALVNDHLRLDGQGRSGVLRSDVA